MQKYTQSKTLGATSLRCWTTIEKQGGRVTDNREYITRKYIRGDSEIDVSWINALSMSFRLKDLISLINQLPFHFLKILFTGCFLFMYYTHDTDM